MVEAESLIHFFCVEKLTYGGKLNLTFCIKMNLKYKFHVMKLNYLCEAQKIIRVFQIFEL